MSVAESASLLLRTDVSSKGIASQPESADPAKWSKLERLRFLLDSWSEIWEPNINGSIKFERGGSGLDPRLPAMAHDDSVIELERCLAKLGREFPKLYSHLFAYRIAAQWRQVKTAIKFLGPNGRWLIGAGWKRERIVPSWIEPWRVSIAESLLLHYFQGELYIPKELWDGLTKPQGG